MREFVHVGYSKALSTWLQTSLQAHPDIELSVKSGLAARMRRVNCSQPELRDQLRKQAIDRGRSVLVHSDEHLLLDAMHPRLRLRITNSTLVQQAIDRIRTVLDKPSIIIAIRNQAEMITSRYVQYIRGSGGRISFDTFLKETLDGDGALRFLDYRYDRVIRMLRDAFGPSNVHVIVQEAARQDSNETLTSLFRFLQVSQPVRDLPKQRTNRSPPLPLLEKERLLNQLWLGSSDMIQAARHSQYERLCLTGARITNAIVERVGSRQGNTQPPHKQLLASIEKKRITQHFFSSNEALRGLLGEQLGALGYE